MRNHLLAALAATAAVITAATDHIPGPGSPRGGINLEQFFAANGWACKNPEAIKDLKDYGFLPLASGCGATS